MKTDNKVKETKQMQEKTRNSVAIRFSQKESAVLSKMMEAEDWGNRSGFIKYKIFGESEEYQYKKMLESGEEKDIQKVIVSLVSDMNRQIDYINFRFDSELIEFKNQLGRIDEIKAKKWLTYLEEWKTNLQRKTDEIFFDCETILRAINIKVERKDFKDVRNLPDYVLEKAAQNWNDTDSPMVKERARRQLEKFYEENPKIASKRPGNKSTKDKDK